MIPVVAAGCPIVLAHRGGADEAAENSTTAFVRMRELGVHHIETDAHVTADGVVVLHHDDTVDRTYDGSGRVEQLTWAELSAMRNGAGETMPVLAEVLERNPDLWFNIDAKTDEVVEPLLRVIDEADAWGRVMVASFSERRLERIRRHARANISTSLGMSAVARLVGAAQTATNPGSWHVPGPRQGVRAVQVPRRWGPVPVVTPRFIATAHTVGLAVHVWTVNEPEEMVELIEMGVDGLVTDRPSLLKEILVERGQWRELPTPEAH